MSLRDIFKYNFLRIAVPGIFDRFSYDMPFQDILWLQTSLNEISLSIVKLIQVWF